MGSLIFFSSAHQLALLVPTLNHKISCEVMIPDTVGSEFLE